MFTDEQTKRQRKENRSLKTDMITAMESVISAIKKIIPQALFRFLQIPYHYLLALFGAIIFGFPSRKIKIIAVTGTKGKSSVVELVSAILTEAGFKTAHASTIQFKINETIERNLHKMTTPGRFFLQKFLRRAVRAGCTHAVIEMTSEGARQFRHKFIAFDALIFTNLSPEHIESHGSYENYVAVKVSLAKALEKSPKENKKLIVNGDDKEAQKFLDAFSGKKIVYKKQDAENPAVSSDGVSFTLWEHGSHRGTRIESKLPGEFNLYNILAAASYAGAIGIAPEKIKTGIEKVESIRGRAERITLEDSLRSDLKSGERSDLKTAFPDFTIIVDYAHTPDSLEKLYQAFTTRGSTSNSDPEVEPPNRRLIAVLGNTGGGRDKWKRPVMGAIAEKYCDEIILTNEDPYDEDPKKILEEMAGGIKTKKPEIILDRCEAIAVALKKARRDDVVLITGKGTDPYIMGPNGNKLVWDDATVVREELQKLVC